MTEPPPPRLVRFMNSLPEGVEAFNFLSDPTQVAGLLDATRRSLPAVCGISAALFARFGQAAKRPQFKQFVGLAVRHLLETQHGYVVADRGVKVVGDPVFSSGARYRPAAPEGILRRPRALVAPATSQPPTLAARLLAALDDSELRDLAVAVPHEMARRGIAS